MRLVPTILGAAFLAALTPIAFSQQFFGAIQTTKDGTAVVNANLYDNKADVFLTGGPQNTTSQKIPDGYYYFQVTNSAGSELKSLDPVQCRQVQVINGVIARSFDGISYDGGGCSHSLGTLNLANGQRSVQVKKADLQDDFTDSSNGVYKLWLIAQAPSEGRPGIPGCLANNLTGVVLLNPPGGCHKTDNFKVKSAGCTVDCGVPPNSTMSGRKYFDKNKNGTYEEGVDSVIPGWQIDVFGTKIGADYSTSVNTDPDGVWTVPGLDAGTQVTACEVLPQGWTQTGPLVGATVPNAVSIVGKLKSDAFDPLNLPVNYANYAGRCWQGTVPATDTTGLNFGNRLDLGVSKTADPAFTRTYAWSITKNVDQTLIKKVGGSAIFNYTVVASETGFSDKDFAVSGVITVNNPTLSNIANVNVTDAIDNGGSCSVTNGAGVTLAPGNNTFNYSCTFASNPGTGTNTATATWALDANTGTRGYAFGSPTSTVKKTVTVQDNFNGTVTTLGSLTAVDSTPYTTQTYTYAKTVSVPSYGCVDYNNTATIVDTPQTASQKVTVCGPVKTGALTMGFWQNKNGQDIIKADVSTVVPGVCNLTTWLTQFNPFKDLTATKCSDVAAYVTNIIKAANASGASMNAMLKAQDLATSLDVYFSTAALGGNKIGSPILGGVGAADIDLTKVCKNIPTCTIFESVSSAFGGATHMKVGDLLTYAAGQSNSGGSSWYGQNKAIQEFAKDVFDAINNQVAFAY